MSQRNGRNTARSYMDEAKAVATKKAKRHAKETGTAAFPVGRPAIAHELVSGSVWRKIYKDEEFVKHGMSRFFNEEFRIAAGRHDDQAASDLQLALWPDGLRQVVKRIDRAAVFVPSREEWVRLEPEQISKAQTKEAGLYLRQQANDTARRADAVLLLADLMPDAPEKSAAA